MKINASIIGATGYVGLELIRILKSHGGVNIAHLVSSSSAGENFESAYPHASGCGLPALETLDIETISKDTDVFFTSLPHGASKDVIPSLCATGKKVIDMSGDYRYNDASVYEQWYGVRHDSPELLKSAVYGLPELHRERIKSAGLIGNPGCYTTCSILALAPLISNKLVSASGIIIDAKSGTTGAGRKPAQAYHFCEVNESLKAYSVATHRHTSEIEQELSNLCGENIAVTFAPHLLPINRGILATCYANMSDDCFVSEQSLNPNPNLNIDAAGKLIKYYEEFYSDEPFVKICAPGALPEIKHAVGSNNAIIGLTVDMRTKRVVVVCCIDNLIKGAAGQAVQNMNILFGLSETAGLDGMAWYL